MRWEKGRSLEGRLLKRGRSPRCDPSCGVPLLYDDAQFSGGRPGSSGGTAKADRLGATDPNCCAKLSIDTSFGFVPKSMFRRGRSSPSPRMRWPSPGSQTGALPKIGRTGSMQRGEIWVAETPSGARPVLVLTRDPVAERIGSVVVAVLTRTQRGVVSELRLTPDADGVPTDCVVNFDNLHTLPSKRLSTAGDQAGRREACGILSGIDRRHWLLTAHATWKRDGLWGRRLSIDSHGRVGNRMRSNPNFANQLGHTLM